ncbi:hypothetical protein HDU76_008098, partial [Blyttiomyces sp. JEL0837]
MAKSAPNQGNPMGGQSQQQQSQQQQQQSQPRDPMSQQQHQSLATLAQFHNLTLDPSLLTSFNTSQNSSSQSQQQQPSSGNNIIKQELDLDPTDPFGGINQVDFGDLSSVFGANGAVNMNGLSNGMFANMGLGNLGGIAGLGGVGGLGGLGFGSLPGTPGDNLMSPLSGSPHGGEFVDDYFGSRSSASLGSSFGPSTPLDKFGSARFQPPTPGTSLPHNQQHQHMSLSLSNNQQQQQQVQPSSSQGSHNSHSSTNPNTPNPAGPAGAPPPLPGHHFYSMSMPVHSSSSSAFAALDQANRMAFGAGFGNTGTNAAVAGGSSGGAGSPSVGSVASTSAPGRKRGEAGGAGSGSSTGPLPRRASMSNSSTKAMSVTDDAELDPKQAELLNEKRRRRRESHNAVERRRRDNINEKIQELHSLLPEFAPISTSSGAATSVSESQNIQNKGAILRRSVEYIKMMQALATRQQERMRELEG